MRSCAPCSTAPSRKIAEPARPRARSRPSASARAGSEYTADAFRRLLLAGAGADKPGRIALFLHADLDDFAGPLPPEVHTESNVDITDDSLWSLLAGADVTPIFTRGGMPLSYGRTRRLAPFMLRRATAHRDRRCRFAWCDQPSVFTRSHHVEFWERGGTTDPENSVGQCNRHHHDLHDRGWKLSGTPPDMAVTRPDGTPHLDDQRWRTARRERIAAHLERDARKLWRAP